MEKLKIGVLLSGSGTNLQAIIDEIANGLPVEIVHVLSSRPDAYGIERARAVGIPVTVFDRSCYEDREAADARIAAIMQEAGAEYLVMAGYMRKLTPVVLDAFPDHVLNLHPALLPSFKGAHAIQDAWDAGVKVTGVTVHLANEDYDNRGPASSAGAGGRRHRCFGGAHPRDGAHHLPRSAARHRRGPHDLGRRP